MLLKVSRRWSMTVPRISPALCSGGDVGRRAAVMSTGRERLLFKEARMRRQRKWSRPMRALFRVQLFKLRQ